MRNFYLLFLFLTTFSYAQEPFVMIWDMQGNERTIFLNTFHPGEAYNFNYTVDFGDGTVINNVTQTIQHTYSQPGIYAVSISGNFPYLNLVSHCDNLASVEQWGDIVWEDMRFAFASCENLIINATDAPNLSQVVSLSNMFNGCNNFNQYINHWDVYSITDMSSMFAGASSFNQPLDNWDVSNVTNMGMMFSNATSFNQSIDNWDVSSVNNMESMFFYAISFNQSINNWNVSNVSDMTHIFLNASSFNQPLDNWDVSNVTNMSAMFFNATSFNQPINNWNTFNLESIYLMFYGATAFNQALNMWNTSSLVDVEEAFSGATSFNQALDTWDFSNLIYADNFMDNSGLDVFNYDSLLDNLTSSSLQSTQFNVTGLQYCNESARNYLINNLGWTIYGDSLSEDCNTVFGAVLYDSDNNGCTIADIPSGGFFLNLNNGINDYATSVTNGSYSISATEEAYTVSLTNVPDYFTVNPISAYVDFATTTNEQVDFCLTANQTVNDLNITLLQLDDARPGFESNYRMVVENVGTQTISNITTNLTFDETKQSFVSSVPSSTSSSANTIEFSISSLNPFQKQEVDIVMQTFTPPTVNGDDVLSFVATILPDTSDYTPNDNTHTFDQIVVNSFDPNDKRILQGDFITTEETDEYLDYIIRFQNTGTANATFVRIEDVLDADLDWSTLKITSASHAYQVTVSNGNEVEFKFDNINLPYEALDEEGSNGFIAYKIKPKSTIQLGDIMSGDASIFFDFNLPIITNTVSTEVVNPLSTDEFNFENLITVYPNPSNNGFFLKVKNGVNVASFQVYNLQGSKLIDFSNNSEYVDTKSLTSGVYFLTINTDRGNVTEKIIIN